MSEKSPDQKPQRDWRKVSHDGRPWVSTAYWICAGCQKKYPPKDYLPGTGSMCEECVGPAKTMAIRCALDAQFERSDEWTPVARPVSEIEEETTCARCGKECDGDICVGCMAREADEKNAERWKDAPAFAPKTTVETVASGPYAGFKVSSESKRDPARAAFVAGMVLEAMRRKQKEEGEVIQ